MRRKSIGFVSLALLMTMASCQVEDIFENSNDRMIGVYVKNVERSSTKSAEEGMPTLNQVIALNDDFSIEEVISEDYVGCEEMTGCDQTKGTITSNANIGFEDKKGPKYFSMMGFMENPEDMDAEYESTPNPYVNYGIAFRDPSDNTNKKWQLVDHETKDPFPWLWEIDYDFWAFAPVDPSSAQLIWGPDDVQEKNKLVTNFYRVGDDGPFSKMEIKDYETYKGKETDRVSIGATYNDTKYQHDLVVAYKARRYDEDNRSEFVDFTFKHGLAAIRFNVLGVPNLTVKNVKIVDVYGQGDCVITPAPTESDKNKLNFAWTTKGTKTFYWQTYSSSDFDEEGLQKSTGDKIFFMIPQALTSAKLGVTFLSGDGSTEYIEKPISTTWEAGKLYTYNIVFNGTDEWEYVLEPVSDVILSHEGGSGSFDVYSYRVKKDDPDIKEKVSWKLQYFNGVSWDNAYVSTTSWMSSMLQVNKKDGSGGIPEGEFDKVSYSVKAQDVRSLTDADAAEKHATILRSRMSKVDYDLSFFNPATGQETATRNTANCYVVSSPGTYRFPLVYGNGVKNGSVNNAILSPDKSTTGYNPYDPDALKTFVGHDDLPITDPYIFNSLPNPAEPFETYVLWEDSEDLINWVRHTDNTQPDSPKDGDKYFVTFEITPEKIHQGNAVIAVVQNSTILWSWHIWVTDEDLSKTQRLWDDSVPYDFMPFNLGWCSIGNANGREYDDRAIKLKIVANQGGHEEEFIIEELGYAEIGTSTKGYCPFYQWGRKDPLIPGTGENGNDHVVYNSAGKINNFGETYLSYMPVEAATIGKSIKNPMKMYGMGSGIGDVRLDGINQDDWCEGHFYNWSHNGQVTDREYWNQDHHQYEIDHLHGCGFANLWSAHCTRIEVPQYPGGKEKTSDPVSLAQYSIPVVKTIYDPSPVGFSIPDAYAFRELLDGTRFNTTTLGGEYDLPGGGKFFFPATGYRGYNTGVAYQPANKGQIVAFGTDANMWTSTSNTRQRASYTSIGQAASNLTSADYDISVFFKNVGACVRPVKEKDIINLEPEVDDWKNGGKSKLTLQ